MSGLYRSRWIAGAAALAVAVSGCTGGGGDDGQAASGGRFSVYICEPQSLIPQNATEVCGAEVLAALFTPLVEYDADTSEMELTGVAERIDSTDQKVWTIALRDGYRFHNGEAVDAASFARAWNAGAYGPNAYGNSYFFERIEGFGDLQVPEGAAKGATPKAEEMSGVKAVDPLTLEVTLKEPFSQFPVTLGAPAFYPLPRAFDEDPEKFNEAPIGNGPFEMDGTWKHNEQVAVTRNDDYAGEKAEAGAATFRIYSDINTAYNDLLAGDLDIMDELPPERVAEARSQLGDRYLEKESSQFSYLGYPLYDRDFANPDLRAAFSMAIDRQEIIDALFGGAYTPATSLVAPAFSGGQENPCGEACTFDPVRAKQLYDRAGGYDGTLTLWLNSGAGHEKWVEAVANQLRGTLGITDVRFRSLDFAQYLEKVDKEEMTGPFRLSWVADYPSPESYLAPLYATEGSANDFRYANPRVDELIAEAGAAGSVEKGVALYNQAEKTVLGDMPIIPMWFEKTQAAHSARVGGVQIDAFARIHLAEVTVR